MRKPDDKMNRSTHRVIIAYSLLMPIASVDAYSLLNAYSLLIAALDGYANDEGNPAGERKLAHDQYDEATKYHYHWVEVSGAVGGNEGEAS
jgi:hypothetical protein